MRVLRVHLAAADQQDVGELQVGGATPRRRRQRSADRHVVQWRLAFAIKLCKGRQQNRVKQALPQEGRRRTVLGQRREQAEQSAPQHTHLSLRIQLQTGTATLPRSPPWPLRALASVPPLDISAGRGADIRRMGAQAVLSRDGPLISLRRFAASLRARHHPPPPSPSLFGLPAAWCSPSAARHLPSRCCRRGSQRSAAQRRRRRRPRQGKAR